jgi:hypothetical protein
MTPKKERTIKEVVPDDPIYQKYMMLTDENKEIILRLIERLEADQS